MSEGDALWVLLPTGQRASGEWIDDTLRARAEEQGMLDRLTQVAAFPRQRVEVVRGPNASAEVNEMFYRRGWTDGLPIVPPTTNRVDAMLRAGGRQRNLVLGEADPLKGVVTVEKVAINAVMAGCEDAHMPVVLAAAEALLEPEFNLRGVQTTDENVTPLLMLSGSLAKRLHMNSRFGALGPGWRANAAIGRAVRLIMHNLGGGWPAAVAFAGLGQPGRYSLCLAEDEEFNPWESLREELGFAKDDNVLVVQRAESVVNVTGGLDDLASVMASATSSFSRLHGGTVAVIVAPHVAKVLADEGKTKADVKAYLHANSMTSADEFKKSWIPSRLAGKTKFPRWVRAGLEAGWVPAVEKPEDITVIVAGGDIPIPQCAYMPTWGFPACRIAKKIETTGI
ncbi:MAG: hypothetical protein HOK21_13395 [Rhodospirillaceae bacterium]|nr:hypothetical protein [Rhodospirillaceae bacterium]MBT4045710.1 hypothetical protein [Rhodospirillaceae bacterium]MBT5080650.1 hypothetical protein [Rhodospirillaceae bacterium]MBT5525078.1 hypothetical protein [Rhodospirillaceae bacterium]MBT5878048.1 hypothetical protein [Rhodospirillaceae bacterium]